MKALSTRRFLTVAALSELIDVPVGTLNDWRLKGRGPAYVKVGHAVRYDATVVAAWLDENTVFGGAR